MISDDLARDDKLWEDRRYLLEVLMENRDMYYGLALWLVRDPEQAEEVISQAMEKVWSSSRIDNRDRSQPYVASVVRRCAYDALRRRRLKPEPFDDRMAGPSVLDTPSSLEAREETSRMLHVLAMVCARLTPLDAEIIFLRFFTTDSRDPLRPSDGDAQMPHKEIGRLLDMNPAAVRQALARALKKLRNDTDLRAYWQDGQS